MLPQKLVTGPPSSEKFTWRVVEELEVGEGEERGRLWRRKREACGRNIITEQLLCC